MNYDRSSFESGRPNFNVMHYSAVEPGNVYETMRYRCKKSIIAAEEFSHEFGDGGTAIARAPHLSAATLAVQVAMHPKNITECNKDAFGLIGNIYGQGLADQTITYMEQFPEEANELGASFINQYSWLSGTQPNDDPEQVDIVEKVLFGIRKNLTQQAGKRNPSRKKYAEYLLNGVYPELSLAQTIAGVQTPDDDAIELVRRFEEIIIENQTQQSTTFWYKNTSLHMLSKAVELQQIYQPSVGASLMHKIVEKIIDMPRPDNKVHVEALTRYANQALKVPQLGIHDLQLKPLKLEDKVMPLAIDRIVYVATEESNHSLETDLVRNLGHVARMLAENGMDLESREMNSYATQADLQTRYPGLAKVHSKQLIGMFEQGKTARQIHQKMRELTA